MNQDALLSLKPIWQRFFQLDWKLSVILILLICVPRMWLVLQANMTGNYGSVGGIMLVSAIVPLLLLSKNGRTEIGLRKPSSLFLLIVAFLAGLAVSIVLHFLADWLYGDGISNWYSYIGRSYMIPAGISDEDRKIMFAVTAAIGMTFSPLGEELFFRGVVHAGFQKSWGQKKASLADGLAFSLTHLAHFGIVFDSGKWMFLPIPSLIWLVSMFLVSQLFIFFRNKTNSLLGAMVSHAAFNFGMIFCIFFL